MVYKYYIYIHIHTYIYIYIYKKSLQILVYVVAAHDASYMLVNILFLNYGDDFPTCTYFGCN